MPLYLANELLRHALIDANCASYTFGKSDHCWGEVGSIRYFWNEYRQETQDNGYRKLDSFFPPFDWWSIFSYDIWGVQKKTKKCYETRCAHKKCDKRQTTLENSRRTFTKETAKCTARDRTKKKNVSYNMLELKKKKRKDEKFYLQLCLVWRWCTAFLLIIKVEYIRHCVSHGLSCFLWLPPALCLFL